MPSNDSSAIADASLPPDQPPALRQVEMPQRLLVPLSGRAAAAPAAKSSSASVRRGQTLIEIASESSHISLAPADGTLGSLQQVSLTSGRIVDAVELAVVPQDSSQAAGLNLEPPKQAEGRGPGIVPWINYLRHAGLWADRHSSPDLIGQLNQAVSRPIDMLICSVLDTDAGLRLNAALAARESDQVAAGAALLAKICGARRAVMVIDAYASPAWALPIREAAQRAGLEVLDVINEYPQSDPTLMVFSLRRRRLRPGQLPTTQGVLLLDAAAAMAVGRAARGRPALSTPLGIHDHFHRRAHFLDVPIGMVLGDLLDALQIPTDSAMLRGGDLLRDLRLSRQCVIGGAELAIHVTAPEPPLNPDPCMRCGWCMEACPTLLHPASALEAAQRNDAVMARRAGIDACIECGLCSYVCPSRLPLLGSIRSMRSLMASGQRVEPIKR
jgi:electron transport complex protein RnfC